MHIDPVPLTYMSHSIDFVRILRGVTYDRGKIGLIALHLIFINLGLFMLNTVPGSRVKSCMYIQDRCTIIAKYSIYNFTNTTSLLWSGNRTKTLNYSEVAIRTICL